MGTYKAGNDLGTLERSPFDNPKSDDRIVKSYRKTPGRIDKGNPDHTTRLWQQSGA